MVANGFCVKTQWRNNCYFRNRSSTWFKRKRYTPIGP